MKYDELVSAGRIRPEKISQKEVSQAMELAERDLRVARKMGTDERDWGFVVAYNAVLQAARAYMFSEGFRPASAEAHKNTLAFMAVALGKTHQALVTYLDRMRRKRHRVVYDQAGLISEKELRGLLARAQEFVVLVRQKLAGHRDAT